MLSTPHLLVGAAIGSTVGGVPGAFCFGLLSHLLLDVVPHTDADLLDEPGKNRIMPADYFYVGVDIAVGIAFVLYFMVSENHIPQNVLAGAFGGISPDLISNVPFWSPSLTSLPILKQFHWLHQFIGYKNNGKHKMLGVITQFVAITLSVIILMRQ